jgi:hypothetical protein
MRGPGQTVEQAEGQFNDFVSGEEGLAQHDQMQFWAADPGAGIDNQLSDQALADFARALHAVLDSTSPAHAGFQLWDWRNPLLFWRHHQAEKSINPQQLQTAVSAARHAYNNTFGFFGDPFRLMDLQLQPRERVTTRICWTDEKGKKVCQ